MKKIALILLLFTLNVSAEQIKNFQPAYRNLFYADIGKERLVLTNQNSGSHCPSGYRYAVKGFTNLGEFKTTKELCWITDSKKPNVIIYDPNATLFKTSSISQDKFTKVRSPEEIAAEESAEISRRFIESNRQANSGRENYSDNGRIQPMIINGEPSLCLRIGAMLDCN